MHLCKNFTLGYVLVLANFPKFCAVLQLRLAIDPGTWRSVPQPWPQPTAQGRLEMTVILSPWTRMKGKPVKIGSFLVVKNIFFINKTAFSPVKILVLIFKVMFLVLKIVKKKS